MTKLQTSTVGCQSIIFRSWRMKGILLFAVMSSILFLAGEVISAQEASTVEPESKTSIEPEGETKKKEKKDDIPFVPDAIEEKLDSGMDSVGKLLTETANWLDSFYESGPGYVEENQTRATLKLEFGYSERWGYDFKPRLKLKLKIPKLTRKVNLIISASDDDDFEMDSDPVNGSNNDDTDRSELQVGLKGQLFKNDYFNFSTQVGGSYDYLYGGVRFRFSHEMGNWLGRFTERLRWYTDEGWENQISYYLDTHINGNWMFRSVTSGLWDEEIDGSRYSQFLRLLQMFSEERGVLYEIGVYFDTETDEYVSDIQFRVRYRQRFYRDWLVLEVAPEVTFPKDDDWDRERNLGIVFKFEVDFGYTFDREVVDRVFDF